MAPSFYQTPPLSESIELPPRSIVLYPNTYDGEGLLGFVFGNEIILISIPGTPFQWPESQFQLVCHS